MKNLYPFGLVLLIMSCSARKEDAKPNNTNQEAASQQVQNDAAQIPVVRLSGEYTPPVDQTIFRFSDPRISGDTLTVAVTYTGGCANHEFVLYAPEKIEASNKPVKLELHHTPIKDDCKAIVELAYKFVLTPLRKSSNHTSELILVLGKQELKYVF